MDREVMDKYICIFPFVKIDETTELFKLTFEPGTESFIQQLDPDSKKIIQRIQKEVEVNSEKTDNLTIALLPKTVSMEDLVGRLMRVGDFFRFRLSFVSDEIDYDQACFIVVTSDDYDFIKLSINGEPTSVLDFQQFAQVLTSRPGMFLTLDSKDLPSSGLRQILGYGLSFPNSDKFWRALDWYSKSFIKDHGLDFRFQIVCLAIAFESLLDIRKENMGHLFESYISNLFGNSADLNQWAKDFYELRSRIVHGDGVSERRREEISRKKWEEMPSVYFLPKGTRREYVSMLKIGRPVFRDLVELLSTVQNKRKRDQYDYLLHRDEQKLQEMKVGLEQYADLVENRDAFIELDVSLQDLRRDRTASLDLVYEISQLVLQALLKVFGSTQGFTVLNDKMKNFNKIKKTELKMLSNFCYEFMYFLEDYKNKYNQEFPYVEGVALSSLDPRYPSSNLYVDILKFARDWFDYAQLILHRLEDGF